MEDMTLHRGNRGGKWRSTHKKEQEIRQKQGGDRQRKNKEEKGQCGAAQRLTTAEKREPNTL